MPEEQYHEILELIAASRKVDQKWNFYKIFTIMIIGIGGILTVGMQLGDWRLWRTNMDSRVSKIETIQQVQQEEIKSHKK